MRITLSGVRVETEGSNVCCTQEGHQSGTKGSETEKEVEATFELFDPQEEDETGLLVLLRHSRVYAQLALQPQQLRELARIIAGQVNI